MANKKVLSRKLENFLEEEGYFKDYNVKFNDFVNREGNIKRLYVNITVVKQNGKKEYGKIGYFNVNKGEFIKEGRVYAAGLTKQLQEICESFKLTLEQEEIKESTKKQQIKSEILKIEEEIDELDYKLNKTRSDNINKNGLLASLMNETPKNELEIEEKIKNLISKRKELEK